MAQTSPASLEPRGIDAQSATVRAIAVVGTIFGVVGMSCLPFNLGAWITYGWPLEGSKSTPLDLWAFASTIIGMGLATLLMVSSLMTYKFKPIGRDGLLLWAWASILYGIAGVFFWGRFLLPWLNPQYADLRGPDEIAGLIAWVLGTCLAVVILYHLRRPSIRVVFE